MGDLAHGLCQGPLDDLDAGALIALAASRQAGEPFGQLQQGAAATSNDSLLHRSAGGVEGVFDAQLAVLELGFGGSTHLDHGNPSGQFGDPLLQFFAVVIGVGVVELALD